MQGLRWKTRCCSWKRQQIVTLPKATGASVRCCGNECTFGRWKLGEDQWAAVSHESSLAPPRLQSWMQSAISVGGVQSVWKLKIQFHHFHMDHFCLFRVSTLGPRCQNCIQMRLQGPVRSFRALAGLWSCCPFWFISIPYWFGRICVDCWCFRSYPAALAKRHVKSAKKCRQHQP